MPRPTTLPRWASVPNVNPTSGQANVIEPSSGKKDIGWDFKTRSSRNEDNWFKNITFDWITWFDDNLGANGFEVQTQIDAMKYEGFGPTTPALDDLDFIVTPGIVFCRVKANILTNDAIAPTTDFRISYVGSPVIPDAISSSQQVIVQVENNLVKQIEKVTIKGNTPGAFWLTFEFNGSDTGFTAVAGQTKGLPIDFMFSYVRA